MSFKRRTLYRWLFSACVACLGETGFAQGVKYQFNSLQVPGSLETIASGITGAGWIVGSFQDADSISHGFLLDGQNFEVIDAPNALGTLAVDVNDSGTIIGSFLDGDFTLQGFRMQRGEPESFEILPIPGLDVIPAGINEAGVIVGLASSTETGLDQGFLLRPGENVGIFDPFPGSPAVLASVNDVGEIVGEFADILGGTRGLLAELSDAGTVENVREIVVPRSISTTVTGINNAGQIVGNFTRPRGPDDPPQPDPQGGFVLEGLAFTELDVPGASLTLASDINDTGTIVGEFLAGDDRLGFVAVPQLPLPGDVDQDGDVDLQDFSILKDNFGRSSVVAALDANADGLMDLNDLALFKARIQGAETVPVSEPGTWLLGIFAVTCLYIGTRNHAGQ